MMRLNLLLASIPLVTLLAAASLIFGSTLPQMGRAQELRQEIATLQRASAEGRAAARDVVHFRQLEAPLLQAAMVVLQTVIGPATRPPHLFPLLADLSRETGVRLTSCRRGGPATRPGVSAGEGAPSEFTTLTLLITLEGLPERILDFLGRLESGEHPISLAEVEITRHQRNLLEAKAIITAEVVIRTPS